MTETKTIVDEQTLRVATPRPDRVVEYKKEQLLAQKAEIEAKLAEFDK
jgi:hypothetical protein